MLDFRFLDFCREDTYFYDAPTTDDVTADYPVAGLAENGWSRERGREWTVCTPPDHEVPDQGWKIHVSATPTTATDLLEQVAAYCVEHTVMFKFINNEATLARRGGKYGDRSASGKFITIYPVDDAELHRTLLDLDDRIGGTPAPYILSDLRWGRGPLYVRYGGFALKLARTETGALVPGIERPDGTLVPDERRPAFRPPEWVELPTFLEEARAARNAGTLKDFPFRVYKALHFSNGGGVYRAIDTRSDQEVLLREARPLAGLDASGADALDRLEREHWALTTLAGLPFVPTVVDHRQGHEHRYLAREYVDGTPLVDLLRIRHPYSAGTNTPEGRRAYRDWATSILVQVEEAIAAMHDRGVVFGDLHPGNILVKPDDTIAFIDLETATPAQERHPQSMGALGFYAPGHLRGVDVDRHSLAVLRLTLFAPMPQLVPWGPAKVDELIKLAVSDFELPDDLAARLRGGFEASGVPGTRDHTVAWPVSAHGPEVVDLGRRIAASIRDVATPERDDRLFPGDARQFLVPGGGFTFGHGAAGSLWALARTGHGVDDLHESWLARHIPDPEQVGSSFWEGSAGVAFALAELGHTDLARAALPEGAQHCDLDRGAGLGLVLLDLADRTGDDTHLAAAVAIADRLLLDGPEPPASLGRIGYLRGNAAVALLLDALAEHTGSVSYAEGAARFLRCDLDLLAGVEPDKRRHSVPPGLMGSAGLVLTLDAIRRRHPRDEWTAARAELLDLVVDQFGVPGNLFHGRAGNVLALASERDGHEEHLAANLRALGWEAVSVEEGRIDFLGDHGHRLSTDLATGSAGVLLALGAGADGRVVLPFSSTPSGVRS